MVIPQYTHNAWFHVDFARAIKQQPGVELMMYGFRVNELYSDLAPITFNPSKLLNDIKKEFNFDLVVMDGKSRMFTSQIPPIDPDRHYNIQEGTVKRYCWLPKDFYNFDIPKIILEGDYHQHKSSRMWFVEAGIGAILHKHIYNVSKGEKELPSLKHIWLPASVDNNIFKPNENIIRKQKVCFVGTTNPNWYKYRNGAIKRLKKHNLIDTYTTYAPGERRVGQDYIECLQSYMSHLSCSTTVNITTAKMFEIMSSGSVLLTDFSDLYGLKELFPDNSYCTYNRNYNDLLYKTNLILTDKKFRENVVSKALKCISERHTHSIRAIQFLNIIKQLFNLS
jgi:hypothetical protein